MLPRQYRLSDDYDFRRVRRLGQTFFTPLFNLTVAPAKDRQGLRFGFIASTKLDKRSTVRHRAVRLLREAVQATLPQWPKGVDVVFVVRPKLVSSTYEEVGACLNSLLPKISLPRPRPTPPPLPHS